MVNKLSRERLVRHAASNKPSITRGEAGGIGVNVVISGEICVCCRFLGLLLMLGFVFVSLFSCQYFNFCLLSISLFLFLELFCNSLFIILVFFISSAFNFLSSSIMVSVIFSGIVLTFVFSGFLYFVLFNFSLIFFLSPYFFSTFNFVSSSTIVLILSFFFSFYSTFKKNSFYHLSFFYILLSISFHLPFSF